MHILQIPWAKRSLASTLQPANYTYLAKRRYNKNVNPKMSHQKVILLNRIALKLK